MSTPALNLDEYPELLRSFLVPFDESEISQRKGSGDQTFSYVPPERYRYRLLKEAKNGFTFEVIPSSLVIGKEGVAAIYRLTVFDENATPYTSQCPVFEPYTVSKETGEPINRDQTMSKLSSAGIKACLRELGMGLHLYDKEAKKATGGGSSAPRSSAAPASTGPWTGEEKVTFGKYNGTPWKDIEDGYLSFITKDPEKANALAMKEIARRQASAGQRAQESLDDDQDIPF